MQTMKPTPLKPADGDETVVSRLALLNSSSASNVYLRIKGNAEETAHETAEDIYTVLNSTTFHVKKGESVDKKFAFTEIFNSGFSQADFFYRSVRQQIVNFILGESLTIVAYGASNSGKTYTMYGTPEFPGIIPRAIDFLFAEINCTLAPWYKITDDRRVISLNEHERAAAIQIKESIINPKTMGKDEFAQARLSLNNSSPRVSGSGEREFCNVGHMSSVWISIAEIYNENVYDLLTVDDQEKRQLKLTTRRDGSTCVKDLRFVHITTAFEACQLLVSVQSRMAVAATAANTTSSQSHTFLTVKLLKYEKENAPDEVHVSTLTFCDVAGYRRSNKTDETSVRQTESRGINNSLLVLGRCLKNVRDSHSIGEHVTGPFRESKLTRILQNVLAGRESVSFIVTIDTAVEVMPETLSVLCMSAMAKRLGVQSKTLKRNVFSLTTPRSPKSSVARHAGKASAVYSKENDALRQRNKMLLEELEVLKRSSCKGHRASARITKGTQSEYAFHDYQELKEENERLTRELKVSECDRLNRELVVRQELADQYSAAVAALEASWKKRADDIEDEGRDLLKWSVNQVETFYKERIDSIAYRKKRKRNDSGDDGRSIYEDLEIENTMVTSKVVALRDVVCNLKAENELLATDRDERNLELMSIKGKLQNFRDSIGTHFPELFSKMEDNGDDTDWLVREFKCMLNEKTTNSEALEKDLNRAKDDYLDVSSKSMEMEKELHDTKIELQATSIKLKCFESEAQERGNTIRNLELQLDLLGKDLDGAREYRINYDGSKYIRRENDSTCSVDFFYNDSSDNTELMSESRAKQERFFDCDQSSLKKVSLNSVDVDIDRHAFRSSDSANTKEDSGIDCSYKSRTTTSVNSSPMTRETSTQTEPRSKEISPEPQFSCASLKSYCDEGVPCDKELSQQVNDMNSVITTVQNIVDLHKSEVADCKGKLASCEIKMEELRRENDNLTRMRGLDSDKYNRRISELSEALSVKEEDENRNFTRLKQSLEKCTYIENQLSMLHRVHDQIDTCYSKCNSEHISKIEELKNELSWKALETNKIADDMAEKHTDLLRLQRLHEKVNRLETILENYQEEKNNYRERFQERLQERLHVEVESIFQMKLNWLSTEIRSRDDELVSLKAEINDAVLASNVNGESLRSLGEQMVRSNRKLRCVKKKLTGYGGTETRLQESSRGGALDFESRSTGRAENNVSVKEIQVQNEGTREEVDGLKLQLLESAQKIALIKKHRRDLIIKYECMVQQLRIEIEKKKRQLIKLRKVISTSLSKRCRRCCCGRGGEFAKFRTQKLMKRKDLGWKIFCDNEKDCEEESHPSALGRLIHISHYAHPLNSESPIKNEESDSSSSGKTGECCPTESSSRLNDGNLDVRQIQSDASDCSEVPCGCGIGFKNASRQGRMSGWMKVRRSNATTDLLCELGEEYPTVYNAPTCLF